MVAAGSKGLFIKELERSLLGGEVDLAVHSMKDMEAHFALHTEIGAVLAREDRRDTLVGSIGRLMNCQSGLCWHRIGAAGGNFAHHRPDLQIKLLRGNINRRLGLLEHGEFDAIILALAGINGLVSMWYIARLTQRSHRRCTRRLRCKFARRLMIAVRRLKMWYQR